MVQRQNQPLTAPKKTPITSNDWAKSRGNPETPNVLYEFTTLFTILYMNSQYYIIFRIWSKDLVSPSRKSIKVYRTEEAKRSQKKQRVVPLEHKLNKCGFSSSEKGPLQQGTAQATKTLTTGQKGFHLGLMGT